MSKKPLKKSDLQKIWSTRRLEQSRRFQPVRHLIVTEGTKTEPAYFQAVRQVINRVFRDKISLEISGEGVNTVSLFEIAKIRAKKAPDIYRHVWIVYDTDDFPAEHIDKIPDLCRESSSSETVYHAIWSNQCFELWYLLHFSYLQSDLHRSAYCDKISQHLRGVGQGTYEKNRTDMYAILQPYLDAAITNAKRLANVNGAKPPSKANPGTRVFELMDILRPYL